MRRRSLRACAWVVGVCGLASGVLHAEPPARPVPLRVPAAARAVAHVEGTAFAMAALARYANGVTDNSPFDRQVAAWLGRIRNSRATAKRLVSRFERLAAADRATHLPGVAGVGNLETRAFSPGEFAKIANPYVANLGRLTALPSVLTLPPDQAQQTGPTSYAIDYSGLACATQAVAAGDNVAVYTAGISHKKNQPYAIASKLLPSTGSIAGVKSGSTSTQAAGNAWSSATAPWDVGDSGWLFVSALLRDEGDLVQQESDMSVLFGLAQAFAANVPGDDRIGALKQGLDYTAGVLHLSNPAKWSTNAIASRIVTPAEYGSWFNSSPQSQSGMPFRFQTAHDPGGSAYTLFFNTPNVPAPAATMVKVTVSRIAALGAVKDTENGKADFGIEVMIGAQSGNRAYPKDENVMTTAWTVERKMFGSGVVPIQIRVYELDAVPYTYFSGGGFLNSTWSCAYCGVAPPDQVSNVTNCVPIGPCSPTFNVCDVSPKGGAAPDTCASGCTDAKPTTTLSFDVNLATGAITGDLTGKRGDTLTSTGGASEPRRTAIDVKIE